MNRQFNIDALDPVGVFTHAIKGDYHVFVDFEGVGMLGNGGSFSAIEPKLFARFRRNGDEAFAHAGVRNPNNFRRRQRDRVFIVAHDVAKQRHLW